MHARFFFYLFTASLLQPGAAAFAEEGHFSIPEKAVPLTSQPVQGIKTSDSLRSSPPAGCEIGRAHV